MGSKDRENPNDREAKLTKLAEQRNKAIKSLTTYKESGLPVSAVAEYLTFTAGTAQDGKTYKVKFYAL